LVIGFSDDYRLSPDSVGTSKLTEFFTNLLHTHAKCKMNLAWPFALAKKLFGPKRQRATQERSP